MKKKYLLGLVLMFLTTNLILVSTKAETEVVYSLEGNITYRTDNWMNFNGSTEEWKILYNISIPIKLYGGDELYWYQKYSGECDVLWILYQYAGIQSMILFGYINPGDPEHSICENTRKYTIPNDSFGGNGTYLIIKRHPQNVHYDYHLTWEFWIEKDIVEPSDSDVIGINTIPFLIGFMCISVILVYHKLRKLKF